MLRYSYICIYRGGGVSVWESIHSILRECSPPVSFANVIRSRLIPNSYIYATDGCLDIRNNRVSLLNRRV